MSRAAVIAEIRMRRGLLRATRSLPRRRRPPRQQQPDGIRLSYFGNLLRVLSRARELAREKVVPRLAALAAEARLARGDAIHLDETAADLNRLLDEIADQWFAEFPNEKLAVLAEQIAGRTSEFQIEQLAKQLKATLGIDVLRAEPWLRPKVQAFTAENVALIKSVSSDYFADLEKRLLAGLRQGQRWEELASVVEGRYGVTESRAKLIARDQVGKLYGDLNRTRQQQLGVSRYRWRTMRDNRVRDEHEDLEGQVFTWDEPPEEGHPGEAIQCRCYAEPILDDLIADVDLPPANQPAALTEEVEQEDAADVHLDAHSGTFLALKVPPDVAARLALPGGEAPEDFHVTLFYAKGLSGEQAAAVEATFQRLFGEHGPIPVTLRRLEVFAPTASSDWKSVLYARVESPRLMALREALVKALERQGIRSTSEHAFKPHVTLKYAAPGTVKASVIAPVKFEATGYVFSPGAGGRARADDWQEVPRNELGQWTSAGIAAKIAGLQGSHASAGSAGVKAALTKKIKALQVKHAAAVASEAAAAKVAEEAKKKAEAEAYAKMTPGQKAAFTKKMKEQAQQSQQAAPLPPSSQQTSHLSTAPKPLTPGQKAALTKKLKAQAAAQTAMGHTAAAAQATAAVKEVGLSGHAGKLQLEHLPVSVDKVHEHLGFTKAGEYAATAAAQEGKSWRNGLPSSQASALDSYKGSGYHAMNGGLREKTLDDHTASRIRALTTALGTAPATTEDIVVWRGFSFGQLAQDPVGYLDKNGHFLHDNGFVSTSVYSHTSIGFGGHGKSSVLLRVKLPKGTPTCYWTSENEHLLQRDADFKITRAMKTSDGYTVLDAEYVGSSPVGLSQRGAKHDAAERVRQGARFGWTEEDIASGGVYFHTGGAQA